MKIAICFDYLCIFIWWVFLWPIWVLRWLTPNPSMNCSSDQTMLVYCEKKWHLFYFHHTCDFSVVQFSPDQQIRDSVLHHLPSSTVLSSSQENSVSPPSVQICQMRTQIIHIDTHLALYPVAWFARCFLVEINGMVQGGVSWQAAYADQVRGN